MLPALVAAIDGAALCRGALGDDGEQGFAVHCGHGVGVALEVDRCVGTGNVIKDEEPRLQTRAHAHCREATYLNMGSGREQVSCLAHVFGILAFESLGA